jgi:two-component system phosphate regulon sensor histidine kinase PhoR
MVALVEPFSVPVLMLDRQRIASANAAAREALGPHIVGQDARVALRHPRRSPCSTSRREPRWYAA